MVASAVCPTAEHLADWLSDSGSLAGQPAFAVVRGDDVITVIAHGLFPSREKLGLVEGPI